MKSFLLIIICIVPIFISNAGQMYKYKDANGNLVFSDKPPEQEETFETLSYAKAKIKSKELQLYYVENGAFEKLGVENVNENFSSAYTLYAKNTFYAPVEIEVSVSSRKTPIRKLIPANSNAAIVGLENNTDKLSYHWALGDPDSVADNYSYNTPFEAPNSHHISQGFNGRFSHTSEYSRYAVDIAMDLGTNLTAVRAGTVIFVKDDYHMSGTTRYFLDKANVIMVLHDDGTIASYAHILMDTARVKVGDVVNKGKVIARSGSSGFSTGPHLHFSIIRNVGLKNVSIPFKFVDSKGQTFTPKRSMVLSGSISP